jgi:thiol-disulfide isomerase/thioredoxin
MSINLPKALMTFSNLSTGQGNFKFRRGLQMSDRINDNRRHFLTAAAMTVAAVPLGVTGCAVQRMTRAEARLPVEGELPSLGGATGWLNSQPLTTNSLRGKVVLIQFCTYTCINWLRTLPYVRAWAEKYKGQGLVVVGVHTPEFAFEKDVDNVRHALKEMKVVYPVALDSDYVVWRAFTNQYWPALYFVDAKGRIRHHQFGEGDYEQSERVIQQLLVEAGAGGVGQELVSVEARDIEAAADWDNLKSPENYVGYERTENFVSPGGAIPDKGRVYTAPAQLSLNQWALSGDWTVGSQVVALNKAGGRIAYRFHARDLHLVMGPAARVPSVRFRVTVEGQPAGAAHGVDVDEQGNGKITEQRIYQLIRQPKPVADRLFEIEFLDAGVEAFVFTFG